MEEKKYEKLDKLFRSRIFGEDQGDSDWNLPSDEIFDDAIAVVNGNSNSRRKVILLWIVGITCGLFLIGLTIWNIQTMENIDAKMNQIIELQESGNTLNAITRPDHTTNNSGDEREISDRVEQNNPVGKSEITPTSNPSLTRSTRKEERHEESMQKPIGIKHHPTKLSKTTVGASPSDRVDTSPIYSTLSLFSLNPIHEIVWNLHGSHQLSAGSICNTHFNYKNKSSILFGISYSPNWSTFRMTSSEKMAVNLKKYDRSYRGFDLALFSEKSFKKRFKVYTGFRYSYLNNNSNYEANHSYIKSMEMVDNQGFKTYPTHVEVYSTTGLHSEDIELQVGDHSIVDHEILNEKTDMSDELKIVKLDFGLGYDVVQKPRYSAGLVTRLGTNFLAQANRHMSMKIYQNQEMIDQKYIEYKSTKQFHSLFFSGYVGMNFQYHLSSQVSFGLEVYGEQSLQSIGKSQNNTLHFKTLGSLVSIRFHP